MALVNSDCRQLARSWQFRTVTLDNDHADAAVGILKLLLREALERLRFGRTFRPSLGVCVRRMKVNLPDMNYLLWGLYPHDDVNFAPIAKFCPNLPDIHFIASTLPQLESLDLGLEMVEKSSLDNLLASTSIRHLRLLGGVRKLPFPLKHRIKDIMWRPTELVLWKNSHNREFSKPGAWQDFLSTCASTLESLKLGDMDGIHYFGSERVSLDLDFPSLRFLNISCLSLDVSALRSLIASSKVLSTLVVTYSDPVIVNFLNSYGHMQSLKALILKDVRSPDAMPLKFLWRNRHINGFALEQAQPPKPLTAILLMLATIPNLRVLSITWDGSDVKRPHYAMMSNFKSLESLHFTDARMDMLDSGWLISHDLMLSVLSPLKTLKNLYFTNDSYCEVHAVESDYWTNINERLHRIRMIRHIGSYVAALPQLEYIYVGQLSLNIDTTVRTTFERGSQNDILGLATKLHGRERISGEYALFGDYDAHWY
ncbi:hypothetical protein F5B20DRAFT_539874, partial [Whalleya microplaca]